MIKCYFKKLALGYDFLCSVTNKIFTFFVGHVFWGNLNLCSKALATHTGLKEQTVSCALKSS